MPEPQGSLDQPVCGLMADKPEEGHRTLAVAVLRNVGGLYKRRGLREKCKNWELHFAWVLCGG